MKKPFIYRGHERTLKDVARWYFEIGSRQRDEDTRFWLDVLIKKGKRGRPRRGERKLTPKQWREKYIYPPLHAMHAELLKQGLPRKKATQCCRDAAAAQLPTLAKTTLERELRFAENKRPSQSSKKAASAE